MEGENLSEASSVAYVELLSSDGLAASTKIALISGRGAGVLALPLSVPTGNYRLVAYTKASDRAEAMAISVFNTVSSARVKNGVQIDESVPEEAVGGIVCAPGIEIRTANEGRHIRINLRNTTGRTADLAVSVTEDDGLRAGFSSSEITLTPSEAETDGEIVHAKIYGKDAASVAGSGWMTAIISAPGSPADTYTSDIKPDGSIVFKTNNIYGERDLICEIMGAEGEQYDCHFAPESPFITPGGLEYPVLKMSKAYRKALLARHRNRINAPLADTLYQFLPKRDNLLFSSEDCSSFHLDDYTRFNTIEDILLELIPMASVRKVKGRKFIRLMLQDLPKAGKSSNVLVMLDGVPVTEHERLLEYDALALSDVQLYPYMYALGRTAFAGVVNFITTKHDMSALRFDDNVRIMDFRGCSYPVALQTPQNLAGEPAGRTLLWQPMLSLPAGEVVTLRVPVTGARLNIRVEGE